MTPATSNHEEQSPRNDETTRETKKRIPKWALAGLGVFFAAVLTAGGTWAFQTITSVLGSGKAPFNANLSDYSDDCESFVIDRSLLEEVPISERSIDEEWVEANGGLQAGPRLIQLSLVANSESAVAINAITLEDVKELPMPPDPIVVLECPPRGGDLADHSLHLNFAAASVSISSPVEGALDFPFRIDANDPEVFAVSTDPPADGESSCYCTWRLVVHWTSGTGDGKEVVDLNGDPVAVVDSKSHPIYWYSDGVWVLG